MKNYLKILSLIWTLTFIAFWLGSGLKWITDWDQDYREIFTTILMFGIIGAGIVIGGSSEIE